MTQRQSVRLCVALIFLLAGLVSVPGPIISKVTTYNKTNIYGTNTTVVICGSGDAKFKILEAIFHSSSIIILGVVCISTSVIYTMIGCDLYRHWGTYPVAFNQDGDDGADHHSDFSSQTIHESAEGGRVRTSRRGTQIISAKDAKNLNETRVTEIGDVNGANGVKETAELKEANTQDETEFSRTAKKNSSLSRPVNRAWTLTMRDRLTSIRIGTSAFISRTGSMFSNVGRPNSRRRRIHAKRFPYKTIIWFILTVVFILTNVTSLALAMIYEPDYLMDLEPKIYAVILCFQKIIYINNIINPLVYYLLDKHFRHVCRNIVPRLKARFAECGT